MKTKIKYQVTFAAIAFVLALLGYVDLIKNEGLIQEGFIFDYLGGLFNSILPHGSIFEVLAAPFMIVSVLPFIPFKIFFMFFDAVCISLEHGIMGLLNPGGSYCHLVSYPFLGKLSFGSMLIAGYFVGWLAYKIFDRKSDNS